MTLEQLMQNKQSSLNEIDWQIYTFLTTVSDYRLTLQQVADAVHVSTTTIFRFCQKLDLSGFGELKVILKNGQTSPRTQGKKVQESYHDIVDYIQQYNSQSLMNHLMASKEVYILARTEMELRLAKAIQRIFFPMDKFLFILPHDSALQMTLPKMSGQMLFILALDSGKDFPIDLQNRSQMRNIYTVLVSDIRYVSVIHDEHLLLPTVQQENAYQPVITPYILAMEMLYLKLQLESETILHK